MPELAPVASAFCPARILRISQLGMTTDGRFSSSTFLPISVVLALGFPALVASRLQQLGDSSGPSGLMRGANAAAIVTMEVFVEQQVVAKVRIASVASRCRRSLPAGPSRRAGIAGPVGASAAPRPPQW